MIPNHVDGSKNQVEVTSEIYVILESGIKLPLDHCRLCSSCKFQYTRVKYYHVTCKFLFSTQESAGNRWKQIRNQAKILHDAESFRRVAGRSAGSATISNHVDGSRNQVELSHYQNLHVILQLRIKLPLLFLKILLYTSKILSRDM